VATQLLSDAALAEDVVQTTFLKVIDKRETYDSRRPFEPWFYRVLRNTCTDALRSRSTRRACLTCAARSTSSGPSSACTDWICPSELILADEPTGNLDDHNIELIANCLTEEHRAGRTLAIVTHDRALLDIAPQQLHLHEGAMVTQP
jgi:RNA polymerase sigma factor (sigma-70 family)